MLQLKLEKGRPYSNEGRIEKEIKTYDYLDSLGIEYYRIDHEPADNMEACIEIDKLLDATICKNLFLCNSRKTEYYLLMLEGSKKFRTADVSKQIGTSRLSFAGAEDMEKYLDITPGSVSVLGLINDTEKEVKLLVDEDILKGEYFGCHPCINTSSLRVRTKDIFETMLEDLGRDMTIVKIAN